MGALDLKNKKHEKTLCFLLKILTGVGALDFKREKHIFLMILSKTSYFTIEMQDHVIFAYFRGASSLKTHFPWSSCSILHKPV